MVVYTLSILVAVLCLIHVLLNYNKKARMMSKIPSFPRSFIIGNGSSIAGLSSVELFKLGRTCADKWNGIYSFWSFPIGAVNIYNPDDVETIISTTKYNEKSKVYSFLTNWLKDGLLLSNGNKWHQRRKILTPAFHFNILRDFCTIIENNSRCLVDQLANYSGEVVDVAPLMSEHTLATICETAMGTQSNEVSASKGRDYKEAIYGLGNILTQRFKNVPYYFDFIFNLSSLRREQRKYLNVVHSFTTEVIKDRKEYLDKHLDNSNDCNANNNIEDGLFLNGKRKKRAMLDLLISAERDGLINGPGIQEEVDTFMFEGHDTTASGLTFLIMLIANDAKVQNKIYQELQEIFGESTRPANMDDLSKMRYLECSVKESLRLYPPVHFISRQLNEPVELSNYAVPAGVMCHIHIYDLHRRPELFENPLKFDPDRFLPENCVGRHPYAYIPFSAGPRNCIGQKFALLEMKSTISALLRQYEFIPVTTPSDIKIISDIVLRNYAPVHVKFVKRNNNQKV
ncbi:cytochrome P450 4c3-like [Aphomia sociella]